MPNNKADLPLFKHQEETAQFWSQTSDIVANFSDAGTGKTRGMLEGYVRRNTGKRCLVIATLSILKAAWGDDIDTFFPNLSYDIAYAKDRQKAFDSGADVVIMNHDGVKWLAENTDLLKDFDTIIIDESTAFKTRTAKRTKSLFKLSSHFKYRGIMSGTPAPNGLVDYWAQVYFLDKGTRLTPNFFHYRNSVTYAKQVGPDPRHVKYIDKPTAKDQVAMALSDISLRYKLEECVDMPPQVISDRVVHLPTHIQKMYDAFLEEKVLDLLVHLKSVSAVHAASLNTKLRQMAAGAVYDENGNALKIHNERTKLAIDLVEEVEHSLVAFNFRHERDALAAEAEKRGISFAIIDGEVNVKEREAIVDAYQRGEYQTIFCHPQSAGHGLTLTKGTRTIWHSPTYNAEHYEQLNRRQYRAGQSQRTEVIRIMAQNTLEPIVYGKLDSKHNLMTSSLSLLQELAQASLHNHPQDQGQNHD